MKYIGKLYGKVAGKYIELEGHSNDIPEFNSDMKKLNYQIEQLTKERELFIGNYKQLFEEAVALYYYYPNKHRKTESEYFREEGKYLHDLESHDKPV